MQNAMVYLPEKARQRVDELLAKDLPEALQFIDSAVSRMDKIRK
ncbi:MAG TPA: hypothetical protein PKA28_15345 [Methylomusa anaerophila]|nr:hypothetical protein [Methylomusa anaerophila]HML89817.1 hypothetical protein [Methylomusa anaerophila]